MAKDKETPSKETPASDEVKKQKKGEDKSFTQDDLDSLAGKVREEEREKYEAEMSKKLEEAKAEAERLAKLSAEEREKEIQSKYEDQLKQREREITMREHKSIAIEKLNEMKVPTHLAEFVVSEDKGQMLEKIDVLKSAFDKAVEESVVERLKGKTPSGLDKKGENQAIEIVTVL